MKNLKKKSHTALLRKPEYLIFICLPNGVLAHTHTRTPYPTPSSERNTQEAFSMNFSTNFEIVTIHIICMYDRSEYDEIIFGDNLTQIDR